MSTQGFEQPTILDSSYQVLAEGLEQVWELLTKQPYVTLALDAPTWTWKQNQRGIALGVAPGNWRSTYLVGIDYQTYRELITSIKKQYRDRAASVGRMIRNTKAGQPHSERMIYTPKEAVNRARTWTNGTGRMCARVYVDPGANKLGESSVPSACRALPGYHGTPMYALDIWHAPDVSGRFVRVWVASPAIRDAWIATINKAA